MRQTTAQNSRRANLPLDEFPWAAAIVCRPKRNGNPPRVPKLRRGLVTATIPSMRTFLTSRGKTSRMVLPFIGSDKNFLIPGDCTTWQATYLNGVRIGWGHYQADL